MGERKERAKWRVKGKEISINKGKGGIDNEREMEIEKERV